MPPASSPGDALVRSSWLGTLVFSVAALVAAITGNDAAEGVSVTVDLVLFLTGCGVFAVAYVQAVRRSRTAEISVISLYLLAGGVAPREVRRGLLGALGVQAAVAVVTALVRLYSPLAFGILVPVFGLGMCGLWAARHGSFPARTPPASRPRPRRR